MKVTLHTGFRSAQCAVAARPDDVPPMVANKPGIPGQARAIGKRAMRDKMPSIAPKKSGVPFGGKASPLFTKKGKGI